MSEAVLVTGQTVSSGTRVGRARILINPEGDLQLDSGEILVVPKGHPNYAVALLRASGLICEQGAAMSHLCTVALEMGVPCITQAAGAVANIRPGQLARCGCRSRLRVWIVRLGSRRIAMRWRSPGSIRITRTGPFV